MPDGQGEEALQRFLPIGERLAGQVEHRVGVDPFKACLLRQFDALYKILARVDAPDPAQQGVLPGLQPDAEAVHSPAAEQGELLFVQCFGVCLHGELRAGTVEYFPQPAEQAVKLGIRKGGGSPAADVNAVRFAVSFFCAYAAFLAKLHVFTVLPGGAVSPRHRPPSRYTLSLAYRILPHVCVAILFPPRRLCQQGGDVIVRQAPGAVAGIEIAIGTLIQAERNVDIKPKHRFLLCRAESARPKRGLFHSPARPCK